MLWFNLVRKAAPQGAAFLHKKRPGIMPKTLSLYLKFNGLLAF